MSKVMVVDDEKDVVYLIKVLFVYEISHLHAILTFLGFVTAQFLKLIIDPDYGHVLTRQHHSCTRIFENTGTAMVLAREDMTIIRVNNEFEKLSGYKAEECENGMKVADFIHEQDLDKVNDVFFVVHHHNLGHLSSDKPHSGFLRPLRRGLRPRPGRRPGSRSDFTIILLGRQAVRPGM